MTDQSASQTTPFDSSDGGEDALRRGHRDWARPAHIFGPAAAALVVMGGLVTGSALAAMLAWSTIPRVVELQSVAAGDVDAAASSLFGPTLVATVEAAKSCRQPLAFVTVQATGDTPGMLRFRSGAYLSPKIRAGRNPFRLALPFPAPVSAGAGQIVVTSDAGGAVVFLRPGVVIPTDTHEAVINVAWNPQLTCAVAE